MTRDPLPLFDLSEPRASGHPAPAQVASAAVPPAPASAPAPSYPAGSTPAPAVAAGDAARVAQPAGSLPAGHASDPGPWPGLCRTFTRSGSLSFLRKHPLATGRALLARGVGWSALDAMPGRDLLAFDRAVLNDVAPGACVVDSRPAVARPRAVTSLAGIQSSAPSTPQEPRT